MLKGETAQELMDYPMIVRGACAGGFLRTNETFRDRTGFTSEELVAKPLLEWIVPEDRTAVRHLLEGGGQCRVRHITSDGSALPLDLRFDEGQVVLGRCPSAATAELLGGVAAEATVSCTLDAIARIQEEQNPGYKCSILLVSEGHFVRGAGPSLSEEYNSAIDGFAIGPTVGSCGTAIYWNVPVIAENVQTDPLWAPFKELTAKEGIFSCWSHPFTSKGGSVLGALAFYSPKPCLPNSQQLSALRAAARMTGLAVERGRAEEELREKRKRELELEDQLRQAAKMEALGVLAGGVAHDFNNVLTTILANAELAQELTASESEVASLLKGIVDASKRAGDFCTQMLAYAGRGSLRTATIELGQLLPQLSALVTAALSKKATLKYDLHGESIFVEGDENQLLQVVMNLITNAAEALGDKEGQIVLGSTVEQFDESTLLQLSGDEGYPAGEYVRLTVSDNGCGMPPEVAARIFDPFFTTKFTGRGLGLAAVKGIVLKHGGLITLESAVGAGTTFTILLPTASPVKSVPSGPVSRVPTPVAVDGCVLLVDDEETIRGILCKRLSREGFEILQAADGRQAIDIFRENCDTIDCVLLDLSMPKLGGAEVCRELHRVRPEIPVVVMSGFSDEEVAERFRESHIAASLQKPFGSKDMVVAIRKAIALGNSARTAVLSTG